MPYKDPEKARVSALERKRRYRQRLHDSRFGVGAGDMRGRLSGPARRGSANPRWNGGTMHTSQGYIAFSREVSLELARAEAKFGNTRWPQTSLAEWGLVLGEECGELQQAIVESLFAGTPLDSIKKEAVQVAAMAFKVYEYAELPAVVAKLDRLLPQGSEGGKE